MCFQNLQVVGEGNLNEMENAVVGEEESGAVPKHKFGHSQSQDFISSMLNVCPPHLDTSRQA